MADRGQIEQVLMNLVTNARDAMPHGGRLTITTEKTEIDEDARPMRDAAAHSYAVIAVSDTGVGIDKKKMEHIFEPFFTTKEVGKGTGLGLSMAYGTIKQHAGFIDVRSETGRGSTFKIYLPLIESDACPAGEETSNALARGTETILLVEDDELVRTVTKAIIELLGYKVLEASNGKDAIALYRENNETVSLVITDVVMPGLSGMDTYNEIKKIKQNAKILFISGYTAEFLRNKGIQDEKINIVSKPLEVGHFSQKIREILDGHLR
jgi:two-component system cell cycle sensor histidine kinase/response regulator CckA